MDLCASNFNLPPQVFVQIGFFWFELYNVPMLEQVSTETASFNCA